MIKITPKGYRYKKVGDKWRRISNAAPSNQQGGADWTWSPPKPNRNIATSKNYLPKSRYHVTCFPDTLPDTTGYYCHATEVNDINNYNCHYGYMDSFNKEKYWNCRETNPPILKKMFNEFSTDQGYSRHNPTPRGIPANIHVPMDTSPDYYDDAMDTSED